MPMLSKADLPISGRVKVKIYWVMKTKASWGPWITSRNLFWEKVQIIQS